MPMTPDQAKALLGVLISYWPKADLPLQTLQLYRLHLLDFNFAQGIQAVTELASTSRFFPTVAELREALVATSDPYPLPDADQAWAEVAAAARNGIYGRPVYSHPAVAATVKAMGGIRELATSDNLMADRAHFLRLYDTCKRRAERAKLLPGGEVGKALEVLASALALPEPPNGRPRDQQLAELEAMADTCDRGHCDVAGTVQCSKHARRAARRQRGDGT